MHAGEFERVPIAAVEPSWLNTGFLPAIGRLLETVDSGRIVWMPCDSKDESDFLIARVKERAKQLGRAEISLDLAPADPTHCWEDLIGRADNRGLLSNAPRGGVCCLHGGSFLPRWFLVEHIELLRNVVASRRAVIVIPIARAVETDGLPTCDSDARLEIPRLVDTNAGRLRQLVTHLIVRECSELRDTETKVAKEAREQLIHRIAGAIGPTVSRTEVSRWLQVYQRRVDRGEFANAHDAAEAFPPPIPSVMPPEPAPILRHQEFRDRFRATLTRVEDLNASFSAVTERALVRAHQPLLDPFSTADPMFWFISLISHLSCLLLDAGRAGICVAAKYRVNLQDSTLVARDSSPFVAQLRDLRTLYQHGLNPDSADDEKTAGRARAWFHNAVGIHVPDASHHRALAAQLLGAWEKFLDDVTALVEGLCVCGSTFALKDALSVAARDLPTIDLFRLSERACQKIAPGRLNIDAFLRKHEDGIRAQLRSTAVQGNYLEDEAYCIVEKYVADEVSRCPVTSDWLRRLGIEPGPEMGKWIKTFDGQWQQARGVAEPVFLASAEEQIKQSIGLTGAGDCPTDEGAHD